jgi:discoidin domain receptor family protein 2
MILILKYSILFAGFEWVGWSNDSVGSAGRPIELTFQFDTVRNFSAMILHTNNMFSKSIQVSCVVDNISCEFREVIFDELAFSRMKKGFLTHVHSSL